MAAQLASQSDRNDLLEFLDRTRDVLESVVEARAVLFRESLRDPIFAAFGDVRLLIESLQGELSVASVGLNQKLGEAGLSGSQLAFKMQGFRGAWDRFKKRGTLALLRSLLNWINTILKSLIAAIPGGEGIVEFKESLETELDDPSPTP